MYRLIRVHFVVLFILLFGVITTVSYTAPTTAKKTVLAELFTANW